MFLPRVGEGIPEVITPIFILVSEMGPNLLPWRWIWDTDQFAFHPTHQRLCNLLWLGNPRPQSRPFAWKARWQVPRGFSIFQGKQVERRVRACPCLLRIMITLVNIWNYKFMESAIWREKETYRWPRRDRPPRGSRSHQDRGRRDTYQLQDGESLERRDR